MTPAGRLTSGGAQLSPSDVFNIRGRGQLGTAQGASKQLP